MPSFQSGFFLTNALNFSLSGGGLSSARKLIVLLYLEHYAVRVLNGACIKQVPHACGGLGFVHLGGLLCYMDLSPGVWLVS
jgi:hypothetical protein